MNTLKLESESRIIFHNFLIFWVLLLDNIASIRLYSMYLFVAYSM